MLSCYLDTELDFKIKSERQIENSSECNLTRHENYLSKPYISVASINDLLIGAEGNFAPFLYPAEHESTIAHRIILFCTALYPQLSYLYNNSGQKMLSILLLLWWPLNSSFIPLKYPGDKFPYFCVHIESYNAQTSSTMYFIPSLMVLASQL